MNCQRSRPRWIVGYQGASFGADQLFGEFPMPVRVHGIGACSHDGNRGEAGCDCLPVGTDVRSEGEAADDGRALRRCSQPLDHSSAPFLPVRGNVAGSYDRYPSSRGEQPSGRRAASDIKPQRCIFTIGKQLGIILFSKACEAYVLTRKRLQFFRGVLKDPAVQLAFISGIWSQQKADFLFAQSEDFGGASQM